MIDTRAALEELSAAAAAGRADTVRVCFSDHYGTLRGRRLAAAEFLSAPERAHAFCDGALVWDVQCEIFEETDYSNFRTGYPDLHARPDLATLAPCGWVAGSWSVLCDVVDAHGAPVPVDPRQALRRALARLGRPLALGATVELHVSDVAAWQAGSPTPWALALADGLAASRVPLVALEPDGDRGVVRLHLARGDALATADAVALARTAARELGIRHGVAVRTMARVAAEAPAARMTFALDDLDAAAARRADDLALLRAPLPLAHPLAEGAPGAVAAASDANPWLAATAVVAVLGAGEPAAGEGPPPSYRHAIDRLRGAAWTAAWLHPLLRHDALALAEREARLRERQVTAWDLDRYGRIG